jgi:hypothetical protein
MEEFKKTLINESKAYLHSFKSINSKFAKILAIDVVSIAIIIFLGTMLNYFLVGLLLKATGGTGGNQLVTILQSMTSEELAAVTDALRTFLYMLIGGFLLYGLVSLSIMGYSRYLVWQKVFSNQMHNKKLFKQIFSWIKLIIVTTIIAIIGLLIGYFIIIIFIQLLFLIIHLFYYFDSTQVSLVIQQILTVFLIAIVLHTIYSFFHYFTHNNKVWKSIGLGFVHFWKTKGRIALRCLFQAISFVVIVLLVGFILTRLFNAYLWIPKIQWGLYALFLSWTRWYFVHTMPHKDL